MPTPTVEELEARLEVAHTRIADLERLVRYYTAGDIHTAAKAVAQIPPPIRGWRATVDGAALHRLREVLGC
jgi:hypothetical protein